ncbi:hypothetical protein [Donghicola sp.]|jgi:hypothetical protein|uniref:hypothetical protein n=1 Tax=Donghicola sp. TaxID=1929294 RepID=UPI0025ECFD04|nr:hypothetical protein [Donghicola sp.]MCT4578578.1 hypothetical protein [Donghicola sp.]
MSKKFWRDGFSDDEINELLRLVVESRSVNDDGSITLRGILDVYSVSAIMQSAISIDDDALLDKDRVIEKAIRDPRLDNDPSKRNFQKIYYESRAELQAGVDEMYRCVFPIWNAPRFLNGRIRSNNVTLNFGVSKSSPIIKRIVKERRIQRAKPEFAPFFDRQKVYQIEQCKLCVATIRAGSPRSANAICTRELYKILGMINLAVDGSKYSRQSTPGFKRPPISEVLIAPHSTIHDEKGAMKYKGYWYENWTYGPNANLRKKEQVDGWERNFRQLRSAVSKSRWRKNCEVSLVKYFKAFSNPNLEDAFLDGWRLFEFIAGTRNEKIENKILRCSSIFEDWREQQLIGNHLKFRRNSISHGHNVISGDEEVIAFQMLQFVHPFLIRYILNSLRFNGDREFWNFLDLPQDSHDLEMASKDAKNALKMIQKVKEFRR